MTMDEKRRIGLIVNPIAGIGGPLAARGSDHITSIPEAEKLGGKALAGPRAERALRRLTTRDSNVQLVAAPGAMGATAAYAAGITPLLLDHLLPAVSTARHTQDAAASMIKLGAELILFAGGDGTACDLLEVVGDRIPLIGIPTGVKMHSAVFAVSPEAAGESAAAFIRRSVFLQSAEIMDADPTALADGRPSATLHGYAMTPALPRLMQPAKGARPAGGEAAIEALGRSIVRGAAPGELVILGPGTTMAEVKRGFGISATLLGVDAVIDGKLAAADVDAATLENLCRVHGAPSLIVGVVGAQGFIFGRGNQQLSPAVIHAALPQGLRIIANREKLLSLPDGTLRADTGSIRLDRALEGYHRVETGPGDTMMMRLTAVH